MEMAIKYAKEDAKEYALVYRGHFEKLENTLKI